MSLHTAAQPPQQASGPIASQPAEGELIVRELIVRELIVLQTDRFGEAANHPRLVPTTLSDPIRHNGRSARKDDTGLVPEAMPLGVMTFEGVIAEPIRMRVELTGDADTLHAHWPSDALINRSFAEWRDVQAAGDAAEAARFAPGSDWLGRLRDSEDRLWIRSRDKNRKERFVLYDVSFRYEPALALSESEGGYALKSLAPERADPPLTLLLRRDGTDGWLADGVAAPWTDRAPRITVDDAEPTDAAAGQPLAESLAPIAELLERRGYNAEEIRLAIEMIASAGFGASDMSLVYVLPTGEIDEHVRLRFKPKPDRVIRTAVVVMSSVDPGLGARV
ncbi:MAG: hypothetical protein ACPGYV_10210, partial [Phycisphaeraceae bacterium]